MLAWLSRSAGQGFLLVHLFARGFFLLALPLALAAILPLAHQGHLHRALPGSLTLTAFP